MGSPPTRTRPPALGGAWIDWGAALSLSAGRAAMVWRCPHLRLRDHPAMYRLALSPRTSFAPAGVGRPIAPLAPCFLDDEPVANALGFASHATLQLARGV